MSFTNRNLKFRGCIGRFFLVSMTSALLLSAATAQATTFTVTSGNDSGPGTLRQAILNAAASGDTINFAVGITTIDLTSGELLIDKNLTINGPGPNLLTVQRSAAAAFCIFRIASASITATISGLKIADGKTPFSSTGGGGIYNPGTLTISNCAISGNQATAGSSIDSGYGGGISNSGFLTITNSTVSGNSASFFGGGLHNGGRVTIINSTISGNNSASAVFNAGTGASVAGGGGINNNAATAC